MSKRRYLLKKEELYTSIGNTILQHENNSDWNCFKHRQSLDDKMTTRSFLVNHRKNLNQYGDPLINQLYHYTSSKKSQNQRSMQKVIHKSKQKLKISSVLNTINTNKTTVKRNNFSINFTSSLKQNEQNKVIATNKKLSHHQDKKQKSNSYQKRQKIPLKQISNEFANKFLQLNEQQQIMNQKSHESQIAFLDQKHEYQQKQQMITSVKNLGPELIDKAIQIQECMKIQKSIQTMNCNEYLIKIESRVNYLQEELYQKQQKIKELLQLLQNEEIKFAKHQKSIILLYKQNEQLSLMLRDLQNIISNTSQQNYQLRLQAQPELKQKQTQFKILQAERDSLLRKKDRLNQQISKLYSLISTKDNQLYASQQKYRQLTRENASIIKAYQKMKSQLQQTFKINETQKFFQQLAQKTQEKTKTNFQIESFRCEKCNQLIYGNQITMDDLAKYHLNEKFKAHIQTYESQVKYWKDELQFIKTQYQHKLQNIRTNLQCTYQKTLLNCQSNWNDEIKQLKIKINIQQELIENYKNILEKSQTKKKMEMNPYMTSINIIQASRSNKLQNNNKNDVINERYRHSKTNSQLLISQKGDSQLVINQINQNNYSDVPNNSELFKFQPYQSNKFQLNSQLLHSFSELKTINNSMKSN